MGGSGSVEGTSSRGPDGGVLWGVLDGGFLVGALDGVNSIDSSLLRGLSEFLK